uniref:Olfactory receptor n=1 Tax=Sander lucioperca TaxID=283035 RepID=A0A8C9XAP5_SANLU
HFPVSYFTLATYFDTGVFKYLYFLLILSLYVFIVCANLLLIVVICMNRSLHEPMYLFLCSLFVNELYGSTGLFPFLLVQILSDIHTISAPFCFLQMFCVYTYGSVDLFVNELYGSTGLFPFLLVQILSDIHTVSAPFCFLQIFCVYTYVCVEFSNLAIMSYDRYLAICYPLQYNTRMMTKKVAVLIALPWLYSFLTIVVLISLIVPLQLCGNIIDKVYCNNYSIVKLACSETTANNIYGLILTFLTVFVPFIIILYTYMRILKVCFSGSKQSRQKAVSTCTPHLASLLNFSFGNCFEILQSRYNTKSVHSVLKTVLSLYYLTCQPLFNPVMYGLKMSKIYVICKRLLSANYFYTAGDCLS